MSNQFNPEMLGLAREVRGLTQSALSEMTGIDQSQISRYERGNTLVPDTEQPKLAEALAFPIDFFYYADKRHGAGTGEILHRRRKTVPATKLKQIDGLSEIYWLTIRELLENIEPIASYSIPKHRVEKFDGDIEKIAALVREEWELRAGPIENVIQCLEDASCMIFSNDFATDKIDETVQWTDPLPPIIVINSRSPGDRLRFSLSHALGHLVMHQGQLPADKMEKEADQFASAFLMPAEDVLPDLQTVTIEHMLQLKRKWRVSMQALIYRAHDLGAISDRRYRSLFQMLSRAGYRKKEPYPIEPERPTKIRELISLYKSMNDIGTKAVARRIRINSDDFFNWVYPEFSS